MNHCLWLEAREERFKDDMRTIEIAENNWKQFCKQVQEICRGGMVTIDLEDAEGTQKRLAENVPLQGIGLDSKSDPCNTNVFIEAGLPGKKPLMHLVIEPIHIRLRNDRDERRFNQLEIIAENGTTIVELHPGLSGTELKKLESTCGKAQRQTERQIR